MIRLMLVLTPVICVLAGIGASETMLTFSHVVTMQEDQVVPLFIASFALLTSLQESSSEGSGRTRTRSRSGSNLAPRTLSAGYGVTQEQVRDEYRQNNLKPVSPPIALAILSVLFFTFFFFVPHCTWVCS